MQKLVFFIEPTGSASTVGNLYMNLFAIDEDARHEIVNIYQATFEYRRFLPEEEKEQRGTDHYIFTVNSHDRIVQCFCFVKLT